MGIVLSQHSEASGASWSVSLVVAVLVVLLPVLLGPQSCTGRHAGAPLSSNAPQAPVTPGPDEGRSPAQQGAEVFSSTWATCHIVMPEATAVLAPAQTGRQDIATLDSDPFVSSQPESLPVALRAETSSLGAFASTRLSFPHPSQGSPHHLRSVVLRV